MFTKVWHPEAETSSGRQTDRWFPKAKGKKPQ